MRFIHWFQDYMVKGISELSLDHLRFKRKNISKVALKKENIGL